MGNLGLEYRYEDLIMGKFGVEHMDYGRRLMCCGKLESVVKGREGGLRSI